jgi:two-component system cell cycle response regulator
VAADGKVLIILGDASEARAIADRLGAEGLEMLTAKDGIEGLSMVTEHKPDVVVCSRTLPKMGGLEVCRLIKRNHKLKHVAVLIVLDEGDDSSIVSSLEVGANDYLLRPLHMGELTAAVRSHFKNRTSITRLKDDNKELATILEITEMLTSTLNSADLFYIIVHKVAEALAVDECSLLRIEPGGRRGAIEASMNPDDADRPELDLVDMPEVGRCLTANKMLYVEDVRRDAELVAAHGSESLRSVLTVPLQLRQANTHRVVFRMSRCGEPLTYREIKFCQIATTVAANALENAYLFESLEIAHATLTDVAKRDPLTQIYNRGHLFERLEAEFGRSLRKRSTLSCILLDVDHFKAVNDELGHQAGDAVLVALGRILKEAVRGHDVVGRYGGEEFLAVLPETDAQGALMVAERIRSEMRRTRFEGVEDRAVTASVGIAVLDPNQVQGLSAQDLVARADEAMYAAKHAGRDRVIVHEESVPASVAGDD